MTLMTLIIITDKDINLSDYELKQVRLYQSSSRLSSLILELYNFTAFLTD